MCYSLTSVKMVLADCGSRQVYNSINLLLNLITDLITKLSNETASGVLLNNISRWPH